MKMTEQNQREKIRLDISPPLSSSLSIISMIMPDGKKRAFGHAMREARPRKGFTYYAADFRGAYLYSPTSDLQKMKASLELYARQMFASERAEALEAIRQRKMQKEKSKRLQR
jgi:hypothetical protein